MSFPYSFPASFPQNTMALTAKLSWTQSTIGTTLTFKDDTAYEAESVSPSDYLRQVEVYNNKDATGTLLYTLTFTGGELTVTQSITEDKYLSAKLIISEGGLEVSSTIINFGSTNFEYNLLTSYLVKGACGCGNADADMAVRYGFIYLKAAEKAVIIGNSGAFNKYIQTSRTWLTR